MSSNPDEPGQPGPPPGGTGNVTSVDPVVLAAGIAVPLILLATGSFLAGPLGRQLRFTGAGGVILFVAWLREKKP